MVRIPDTEGDNYVFIKAPHDAEENYKEELGDDNIYNIREKTSLQKVKNTADRLFMLDPWSDSISPHIESTSPVASAI